MSRTLEVQGLAKSFPGPRGARRRALLGVDLVVRAGSTTVLLGASGSGKSTLLRIVAGLEEADAGRVLLGGTTVADPRSRVPAEERRVGFVFQDLELWPHRTVAENVAFGLPGRPYGRHALRHPRVLALAERLGFGAHLAVRPPTLSGGERQRVALARTLAPEPDVVLHDEPLASLDPDRRADLVGLLREIQAERGATVLHVTHDPAEALALGDEIAVLSRGAIVDRGAPQSLYDAPHSAAGARALGAVNLLEAQRDGTAWRTCLGTLPAAGPAFAGPAQVVLRPERLSPSEEGREALVEACWPRGADWGFRASIEGVRLEGRSGARLETGRRVRLAARGPVVGVPTESAGEEAA